MLSKKLSAAFAIVMLCWPSPQVRADDLLLELPYQPLLISRESDYERGVARLLELNAQKQKCGRFFEVEYLCLVSTEKRNAYGSKALILKPWPAPLLTPWELGVTEAGELELPTVKALRLDRQLELQGVRFTWAKSGDVIASDEVSRAMRKLAEEGTLYDCRRGTCSRLVRAWFAHESVKVEGLATCRIVSINGRAGPPLMCRMVLVEREGTTFILVATEHEDVFYAAAGRRDFSIVLDGRLLNDQFIRPIVRAVLGDPPLSLEITQERNNWVGAKDYFYFSELGKWALQTIRVDSDGVIADAGKRMKKLDVATTLFLSAQNSELSRDFRMPSPTQQDAYIALLLRRFEAEMRQACGEMAFEKETHWYIARC